MRDGERPNDKLSAALNVSHLKLHCSACSSCCFVSRKTAINEIGALEVQTEQHPRGLEMIGITKETRNNLEVSER